MKQIDSRFIFAAPFILGAAMATNVDAAGFQLSEHSANGLGRAYAGEAATVENSSVIFRNPAAMSYFDRTAISVGAVYIKPAINIDGDSAIYGSAHQNDAANGGLLPNLSVVHPLKNDWWVGISLGSNFNTGVEYDSDFTGSHFGDLAEITTADINFSLARKITDTLSIGAGLSAIWGEGRVKSSLPLSLGGATLLDLEGDDWTWNWNIGAMWQINRDNRLGITYKHHATLDLEGTAISEVGLPSGNGKLPLELPAMVEVASFHQLTDRLALHFGINWSSWSRFESLTADIEGSIVEVKREDWQDTFKFSVGTTYQLNEAIMLRAGFAYDQPAADEEHRTITIPDSDRFWYSAGIGYAISTNSVIDLGLTYIHFLGTDIHESFTPPTGSGLPADDLDVSASGHA
ncbi:OmpP1/FadL family transporter [Desulfosediminicola ganghwensis]|uniref:OmpP1/FadL family transporter n=1 Tax=Desulfosediminicola ganghwensis TaxID=2569540 RepID=UPI0010AD458E|nr:outer membrane protein transport protein [Desulfosediminicola ganghwensis]